MAYFVRVTASYDEIKPFCETVPAETLVVYEHDASQVHCHFYIKTTLATDSLKVRLKKLRNFHKTQWSFKTARDELCIRYMAKGKYDPKYVRGYDIEQLNKYKADWKPEPIKKEKPTVYDMALEVHEAMKGGDYEGSADKFYKELLYQSVKVHHQHRKPFCDFSIMKVVVTAESLTIGGYNALERRLLNKLSRQ